jgi:ribokinase
LHSDTKNGAICVVGSINNDLICVLPRLPRTGESLIATSYSTAFGGKGANQAVAAARLGAPVTMIGAIGRDSTGEAMRRNLEANGVDASALLVTDTPSGVAVIHVDETGENMIVVYPGANMELDPGWIRKNAGAINSSSCLVLQLEVGMEAVIEAARLAHQVGVPVLLNPAPARQVPDELFGLCTAVTPNETELGILSGVEGIEEGAALLLRKGVGAVIVTLGKRGCLYMDEVGSFEVASFPVKAVDATAAGDSFNGALAGRIAGGGLAAIDAEALRFCNAAGALAATRLGAQPSIPTLKEVEAFMAGHAQ